MGLLDLPTRIARAYGAALQTFVTELRGVAEDATATVQDQVQTAAQAVQTQTEPQPQPAGPPTQQQRDEQASGQQQQRQRSTTPKDLDDVTIARKVESEIFRGEGRHELKAHIDINAVDGVVYLRGVAKTPDLINTLEAETRAIPEVQGVENLLHLPHTPAPTRTDTPASQRKTRRTPSRGPRTEPRRLNADKSSSETPDAPETLARTRKGRQPAPMGSDPEGKDTNAPAPEDFTARFRRGADEDPIAGERPGTEQPATSTLGTEGGPAGGGGEVVH